MKHGTFIEHFKKTPLYLFSLVAGSTSLSLLLVRLVVSHVLLPLLEQKEERKRKEAEAAAVEATEKGEDLPTRDEEEETKKRKGKMQMFLQVQAG